MAAIRQSDKLMAKLILEEVMKNTLIEANGRITTINDLEVDGFDQVIHPVDLLEDYGWLGSWMHLTEVYASLISNRIKLFKENFYISTNWLGGIEPLDSNLDSQLEIKVLNDGNARERGEEDPISFIKMQLLLRLSLLQSIKVTPNNKVAFSRPAYQNSIISKAIASSPELPLSINRQKAVTEIFFTKVREQIAPMISLDKDITPEKES